MTPGSQTILRILDEHGDEVEKRRSRSVVRGGVEAAALDGMVPYVPARLAPQPVSLHAGTVLPDGWCSLVPRM